MIKKELKKAIAKMLESGKPKREIFKELIANGENISIVANLIASHPSQYTYEQNHKKINTLIAFMFIWALFNTPNAYFIGIKTSSSYAWSLAFIAALIPLLYAYGFYKNHVKAYNIFIVLGLINTISGFISFFKLQTIEGFITICFSLLLLVYVWYVRSKLFPDFFIFGPKKVNGQYVFTSKPS